MSHKKPIPADRFMIEEIPHYKRASGITTLKDEREESVVPIKPIKVSEEGLIPCSFRLHPNQIKALKLRYAETNENVSKIVRDALELYLSDYFKDKTVNLRFSLEDAKTPENTFETKGFRLSQKLIEAVGIVAVSNRVDRSVIIRNAIDEYLTLKDAK